MEKRRLDTLLAERGLFPSRSRAAASVMAGEVRVGAGRAPRARSRASWWTSSERAARRAAPAVRLARRRSSSPTRSRSSGVDGSGRRALDVGASTGGFTDCLLQRGAREVIAVDVGYGLLDYEPAHRPARARAGAHERARADAGAAAARGRGDGPPDLATVDVSFISLAKVLGAVLGCLARATTCSRSSSRSSRSAAGASARAASCARPPTGARRSSRVGRGGARAGRGGARLPLLGAARAEGQPRDVHLARRPRRAPARAAAPSELEALRAARSSRERASRGR